MADNEVIGKVSSASGDVTVTGSDGQQRALNVGDEIHANDVIATGDGSSVIFEFADGSRKGMPANAEITLNDSVYSPARAEAQPASEGISTGDAMEEEAVETTEGASGAEPIGTLSSASGEVRAQAPDGTERTLEAGDPVYAGETILTGDGSLAIFELSDGSRKGLASNAEIHLDESILTQQTVVAEADVPTPEQVAAEMAAEPSAAGSEEAAPAEAIGFIKASSGEVTAIAADGTERTLADGDEIFAGETIITADASTAIIEYADGATSGISSNSEVTLDARPAITAPDAAETAVAAAEGGADAAAEEAAAEAVALGTGIPVGTVSAAGGDVIAVAADGSERKLEVGDEVNADETVMAGDNSTAIFSFYDGSSRGLASNSEMTLDGRTLDMAAIRAGTPEGAGAGAVAAAEQVAPAAPAGELQPAKVAAVQPAVAKPAQEFTEGAVAAVGELDQDVAAIQKAIEEGADPSEEAEATAAGETAADGGHDAVFLARSNQATTPDSGYLTDGISFSQLVATLREDPTTPTFDSARPDTPALLFHTLVDYVKQVLDVVLDLLEDLLETVADLIRDLLDTINEFLESLDVTDLVNNLLDNLQDVGNDVLDGLTDAIVRVIDLVGGGSDDHGHIGDGVADNATALFIAFWGIEDTLGRLEAIDLGPLDGPVDGILQQIGGGLNQLEGAINAGYDQLSDAVKSNIIAGIREAQTALIGEQEGSAYEQVQGGVDQLNAVEDPVREGASPLIEGYQSTGIGPEVGGRASIVGNAVADEIYNDEDGSGVVGGIRGPRQEGDAVEAADGTILGETYDVVDEVADAADTIWTGEKYENGEYVKHGDGAVVDAGNAISRGIQNQDPSEAENATNSMQSAGSDMEQAADEMRDLDPALRNYATTQAEGVQNIAAAVQQAMTPPEGGGGGGGGGTPNPADAIDVNPDMLGDVDVETPAPGGGGGSPVSGPTIDTPEDGSGQVGNLRVAGGQDGLGSLEVNSGEIHGDASGDAGGTPPSASGELMGQGGSTDAFTPSMAQSSGSSGFDVPGVNPGATANLMGDSSAGSLNLQSIHVAADHDSAVFRLSTDELSEGQGGFDINNFHTDTDTLEISDLLGEAGQQLAGGDVNGDSLSKFLHVEDDGEGGSTISVSDGAGGTTAIHLKGVDLMHDENGDIRSDAQIIDSMLASGALGITSTGTQITDAIDPSIFG